MTVLGLLTTTYGAPSAREDLESLLLGVAAEDSHSLEELYHRTRTAVYGLVLSYLKHPQDAEDVAQEVFEALLRSGKRFREPEHLRAWLLRVTVNKCKNLYRAKRRTEVPLTEAIPAPEAAEPSVLDEVRALPAPYRSTLYLHYFEGYTAAEIGRILGAKRNTVLSWLARGRQALRERMIGGFDDA